MNNLIKGSEERPEERPQEHFTMQGLVDLMGQSMQVINAVAKEVGNLSKRFDVMENSVSNVQKEIIDIKENEEITCSQQQAIQRAVHTRVYQLLGVPIKKCDRSTSDAVVVAKYSQLFHSRCYREVMGKGHLRQPYRTTPKKFYDDAMQDIEAWFPRGGLQALKDEADRDAIANRIASEQGYR